ncbi:MAG: hypothetical protein ACI4F9_05625 [Lachnospiraceae bacterium]
MEKKIWQNKNIKELLLFILSTYGERMFIHLYSSFFNIAQGTHLNLLCIISVMALAIILIFSNFK